MGVKEDLRQLAEILKPKPVAKDRRRVAGKDAIQLDDLTYEEIVWDKPIGAGSFGAVWKGSLRGYSCAIKKCRVNDETDEVMLIEEIRHLQLLRHKRLVSFLGVVRNPPDVVMLLEFMPGGDLHTLLFTKKRKLGMLEKFGMALQVSEGLTYLHEMSVVHRDLKTMNIVLDDELNCKICDFGLSLTLERTHVTVLQLQGSPRYMAPEQFEPNAKITDKVDIWQMGCVFLELFFKSVPFSQCKGVQQIATSLLVQKKGPSIPQEADNRMSAIVKCCLHLSPNKRPSSPQLEDSFRYLIKVVLQEEQGLRPTPPVYVPATVTTPGSAAPTLQ